MAMLKDSLIAGDLRVTGTIYGDVPLNDLVDADDLKAIEALTGTSGLLKKTANNTWTLDTNAYTTSSGVTSVRVQATSPVVSSVNTAQSSSLNTTISLADGYGDTKNPYASKTARYVLAAPASAAGAPTFRALTNADVGLSNVENIKLSTWAGSSNITTIGTLSSGTVPWARLSDVPSASTSAKGVIQIGTGAGNAAAGNHTHTFASLTSKPTTLSGYGITDALGWHSTTSKSTELYDFGFYVNANAAAGTGPAGGDYFTILNLPYRKATGNTKADWGWQIGGSTNNDGRLFYRTTGDNVFDDWQEIAHAPRSSSNIGSATQPVYMTSAGVITAGTALKTLAYKDSIGNHSVTTPTGATSRTQNVTLKNNTAATVTSEGTWPTLGTAFTIPNVTAAGTASYANGVLTITNTTTGTAFTVPNVTSIGTKPTFSTTTVAIDKQPIFTVTTQSTTLSHTIS